MSESNSSDGVSSLRSGLYFPTTGDTDNDSLPRFYDNNWWKLAEKQDTDQEVLINPYCNTIFEYVKDTLTVYVS